MELNLDWQARASEVWPDVCYEIRPLRVWAFQELMAFWEAQTPLSGDGEDKTRISPVQSAELMALARKIFPEHLREITGLFLRREQGTEAATAMDICEETPLLPLAGEIMARLIAISEIRGTEEKN